MKIGLVGEFPRQRRRVAGLCDCGPIVVFLDRFGPSHGFPQEKSSSVKSIAGDLRIVPASKAGNDGFLRTYIVSVCSGF